MTVTSMPPTQDAAAPDQKKSKVKLLVAVALVLALAGGGWFFFLKPEGSSEPVAGEVMKLEAVQLNLAGGHYLRLGLALQLTEEAHEADGSKALDATIELFSGVDQADLVKVGQRAELKDKLEEKIGRAHV